MIGKVPVVHPFLLAYDVTSAGGGMPTAVATKEQRTYLWYPQILLSWMWNDRKGIQGACLLTGS